MKLTELMATMGGFIKALLLAGFIIANPISKLSLKTELINRLFNFEGIEEQEDSNQNKEQEEQQIMSRGFSKADLRITKQSLNEKQDPPTNQIQLNLTRNISRPFSQINSKTIIKEGPPITYTESLNTTAAQPILTTNPSNLQHPVQNNIPLPLSKNLSQPRMNQLNLLKIARRKNQSLNDLSTMGLNHNQSKKSVSHIQTQNQLSLQKDKVKLVRTMLKSYVSQHSMKPEDCMKASTILGSHKKEDPDAVFKKLFKSNEKTLTMKLWDYLKYFLGLKKEVKNKQIKFSMTKVNERLDIVFIMKKLIEVDKLKMLFLNESQRKIFEYLPRPIVRLDPEQQQQNECDKYTLNQAWARQMFFNDKNYISKASEAMLAYQEILQKGKALDPLDKKLIEMLDESKRIYFQVDSPTNSPNDRIKRNSLSVINSINHSPKKKKENNMFLTGLQNISPAESIELNEQDIQEMKVQEQQSQNNNRSHGSPQKNLEYQHPDSILHRYDNTRCFNKRNTMHFMKQRTLQFGDLPSEKYNYNKDEFTSNPPILNERNYARESIQQDQNEFDKDLDSIYQQQYQQKQLNEKISNGREIQYDEENKLKQHSQPCTGQFISQQSSSQQQQINQNSASSIKTTITNQYPHQQNNHSITPKSLPKIQIADGTNEIEMPKNIVKTPKYGLFNQFFSPQNIEASPISVNKDQRDKYSSDDMEMDNDYDECPSLGEEKIKRQEIKDNQMHPSCNHQKIKNPNFSNDIEQQIDLSQNTFNPTQYYKQPNNNYYKTSSQQKSQMKASLSTSQIYNDSGMKFNESIQIDRFGGTAANRDNSILNISIEPFTRYTQHSLQNGNQNQKDLPPENTSEKDYQKYHN